MWIHLLTLGLIDGGGSSVTADTKVGGDDAFHEHKHQGWNKRAWKRQKDREDAIAETIEATYRRIMGIAPDPVVVAEIRRETPTQLAAPDYTQYGEFVAWLEGQIAEAEKYRADIESELDDEEALLLLI
jgi:hypothetical protein